MQVMCWWMKGSPHSGKTALICDGAVRSGKTVSMALSFMVWASVMFEGMSFAVCGKTISSVRRNVIADLIAALEETGFTVKQKLSENLLEVSGFNRTNRFYIFGGKDEAAASLIQGMTLAGVLFDEVALMPRSFVEQAIARCSVSGSKLWFNCNPDHPQSWFYKEWIQKLGEKDAHYLHFTMEDNPALTEEIKARYRKMFSGTFYERFIEGKWVVAEGLVYPFAGELLCEVPKGGFEEYAASCDYGTVNPTSVGLWGLQHGIWYRIDEYYYDSRRTGSRRTDDEHLSGLMNLLSGRKLSKIIVDPSAASFITLLKQKGFKVVAARNNVLDGIRMTSTALKQGRIKICRCCKDSVREFGLYRWSDDLKRDEPIKENDHAMDDIRYFAADMFSENEENVFAVSVNRKERG